MLPQIKSNHQSRYDVIRFSLKPTPQFTLGLGVELQPSNLLAMERALLYNYELGLINAHNGSKFYIFSVIDANNMKYEKQNILDRNKKLKEQKK